MWMLEIKIETLLNSFFDFSDVTYHKFILLKQYFQVLDCQCEHLVKRGQIFASIFVLY